LLTSMDDPYKTGMPPFGLKSPESVNPMAHANGLQECRASRSPGIAGGPSRKSGAQDDKTFRQFPFGIQPNPNQ